MGLWDNSFKWTLRNISIGTGNKIYQATELALFSLSCFPFPVFTSTSSDECSLTLFLQLPPNCLIKSCPFESSLMSVVFVSMSGHTSVCCQGQSRALCWEFSDVLISQIEWDTLLWPMQCPSMVREWWSSDGICCCPFAKLCPTLCNRTDCSTPGFPVLHYLPEFASTHVQWSGDAIQPSYPLLLTSPPLLNLSQQQCLFQWVSSSHQVTKVLELHLQHQSFQWWGLRPYVYQTWQSEYIWPDCSLSSRLFTISTLFIYLARMHSFQDLSSPTREWTWALISESEDS